MLGAASCPPRFRLSATTRSTSLHPHTSQTLVATLGSFPPLFSSALPVGSLALTVAVRLATDPDPPPTQAIVDPVPTRIRTAAACNKGQTAAMKLLAHLVAGLAGAVGATQAPLSLLDNSAEVSRIPTSYESAVMGRRILALSKLGTFSTVFPADSSAGGLERRPAGLGGMPIGLMDYLADCEEDGNPTVLAIKIGTTFKNARAGSNISVSMRWVPPYPPRKRIALLSRLSHYLPFLSRHSPYDDERATEQASTPDTAPYSAANLPRFSMVGYLEKMDADVATAAKMTACYTKKHQDARYWLPGNAIHESEWMRLVVTAVYWIGGFGDRAYIGWIPVEEWRKVTRREWESIQLPGERKGWSEWTVDGGEL
ncbi:hypothetical protein DCS_01030 [Drechmeria coniospora]|uniref:CREG-like beta-barrel domain-containing protein n=1 Tax=Drechmeria coniospora TaxID=98403 RepID=A0A151GS02_DRECN|nr:hypothetical protein DCS_01030 [Drechmeria coniospora]KYK59896.1 hypothetical protein DCS_01030 [Drechmeria coniospora]